METIGAERFLLKTQLDFLSKVIPEVDTKLAIRGFEYLARNDLVNTYCVSLRDQFLYIIPGEEECDAIKIKLDAESPSAFGNSLESTNEDDNTWDMQSLYVIKKMAKWWKKTRFIEKMEIEFEEMIANNQERIEFPNELLYECSELHPDDWDKIGAMCYVIELFSYSKATLCDMGIRKHPAPWFSAVMRIVARTFNPDIRFEDYLLVIYSRVLTFTNNISSEDPISMRVPCLLLTIDPYDIDTFKRLCAYSLKNNIGLSVNMTGVASRDMSVYGDILKETISEIPKMRSTKKKGNAINIQISSRDIGCLILQKVLSDTGVKVGLELTYIVEPGTGYGFLVERIDATKYDFFKDVYIIDDTLWSGMIPSDWSKCEQTVWAPGIITEHINFMENIILHRIKKESLHLFFSREASKGKSVFIASETGLKDRSIDRFRYGIDEEYGLPERCCQQANLCMEITSPVSRNKPAFCGIGSIFLPGLAAIKGKEYALWSNITKSCRLIQMWFESAIATILCGAIYPSDLYRKMIPGIQDLNSSLCFDGSSVITAMRREEGIFPDTQTKLKEMFIILNKTINESSFLQKMGYPVPMKGQLPWYKTFEWTMRRSRTAIAPSLSKIQRNNRGEIPGLPVLYSALHKHKLTGGIISQVAPAVIYNILEQYNDCPSELNLSEVYGAISCVRSTTQVKGGKFEALFRTILFIEDIKSEDLISMYKVIGKGMTDAISMFTKFKKNEEDTVGLLLNALKDPSTPLKTIHYYGDPSAHQINVCTEKLPVL